MGLYACAGGGRRVPACFHKDDLGAIALLCCPGPSLAAFARDALSWPGLLVAAINTAYPTIRPDLWIGGDGPACYDPRLWWEPFPKIVRAGMDNETIGGRYLHQAPLTFFAEYEKKPDSAILNFAAPRVKFTWNSNSLFFALHILLWMGARDIVLAGCDMDNSKADYCHGDTLTPTQRENNAKLYAGLTGSLRSAAAALKERGIVLRSATADSPINAFLPYTPLDDVRSQAARRLPLPSKVLHSADAYQVRWTDEQWEPAGVLVGVPPDQADLAPVWHSHYRRHNDVPLAWADFGMSAEMRAWCAQRGRIIDAAKAPAEGWFRKPFAILKCGFARTLWLDVDTEVRGPLAPLLDGAGLRIGRDGLGTAEAVERGMPAGTVNYDSGVIALDRREPLVLDWARACAGRPTVRGDQECLSMVLSRAGAPQLFTPDQVSMAFARGPRRPSTVMHWVGPPGKEYLRQFALPASSPAVAAVHPRAADCGVLTACDASMEWALDWWWREYRKHNEYPVAWLDYGMTPPRLAWCAARGHVINARRHAVHESHGQRDRLWWHKPGGLTHTPFAQSVYMDLDCHVAGNLSELFGYCGDGVAMAHDRWASRHMTQAARIPVIHNAGVIAYTKGEALIAEWARIVESGCAERGFMDDQTAICWLATRAGRLRELPAQYNHLLVDGPPGGATIVHYAGPTGKAAWRCVVEVGDSKAGLSPSLPQYLSACQRARDSGLVVHQDQQEFWCLWHRLHAIGPRVLLEIGSASGGALWLMAQACPPGATILSVDLPCQPPYTDADRMRLHSVIDRLRAEHYDSHLIEGDSAAAGTVEAVHRLLAGREVDAVFIDGDHSAAGVTADLANYGAMVRGGGLIGMHDVCPTRENPHVSRVWADQCKPRGGFVCMWPASRTRCGIGIIPVR